MIAEWEREREMGGEEAEITNHHDNDILHDIHHVGMRSMSWIRMSVDTDQSISRIAHLDHTLPDLSMVRLQVSDDKLKKQTTMNFYALSWI